MDLVLSTSQKQVLSQRMMQSAKILQMSSQELTDYIKELSVENPVIEYEEPEDEENKYNILKHKLEWLDSIDEQNKTYYQEDKEEETSEAFSRINPPPCESLEEHLFFQINLLPLTQKELHIAHYLTECIDENGYFIEKEENVANQLNIPIFEIRRILNIIQTLEPAGVGARNLKECLLIQLDRSKINNPIAISIIKADLETLGKNQLHVIAKKYKASILEVSVACNIIKGLNPKPGNSFSSCKNLEYISPDVIILKDQNGQFKITLNDKYLPKVKINGFYKSVLSNDANENAKEYIYCKIKQAEWAMKCISKRNSTILKTIDAILEMQIDFFNNGKGYLKPMRLLDIAEKIGMHESTVSRAVKEKYIQCCWGVFPMHYFFSNGVSTYNDNNSITPDSIKQKIKSIIETENISSPYSDRQITEKLNSKGINISRRTVAKYRESLGILGTSGRKNYYVN